MSIFAAMNPPESLSRGHLYRNGLKYLILAATFAWDLSAAAWANGGFETGIAGLPPQDWTVAPYSNIVGVTLLSPQTLAGLNLQTGAGNFLTTTLHGSGPLSETDATLGASATLRWPRYGNNCALINQLGGTNSANSLSQTATLSAADIDPADDQIHVRFVIAPVLQDPGFKPAQAPYYFFQLVDMTRGTILYRDFGTFSDSSFPWQTVTSGSAVNRFTDWQLVDVKPGSGASIGDQVQLQLIASGSSTGAGFGELYVDGVGPVIAGISVEASAPSTVIQGNTLTYTLTYRNGTSTNETGVTISFPTPTNTTFQSFSAPGLTVSAPPSGTAGTVLATISTLAGGAGGSFTITVNVNPDATGAITARNYGISSTQEGETLLGPAVMTSVTQIYPIVLGPPAVSVSGTFSSVFTNTPGVSFIALSTTNLATPFSQWTPAGKIVESPAGTYTLTDSATNGASFYRVMAQ